MPAWVRVLRRNSVLLFQRESGVKVEAAGGQRDHGHRVREAQSEDKRVTEAERQREREREEEVSERERERGRLSRSVQECSRKSRRHT